MPNNFASALAFVVSSIAQLYLFVLLLRLLLPWLGADFRNPLAQGVLKITSPLVVPLRRVIPPIGRIDTATLIVTFVILYATIFLVLLIYGQAEQANFSKIAISAAVYCALAHAAALYVSDHRASGAELGFHRRLQSGGGDYLHAD